MIQTIKDSDLIKRSVPKKCNLDQFLEKTIQREDINQQVKDIKEDFKMLKVKYQSEDSPGAASGAEDKNTMKKLPQSPRKRDHKKEDKEKGKSCGCCGKTGAQM